MKDTHDEKFENVDKVLHFFSSKAIKKLSLIKKSDNTTLRAKAPNKIFSIFFVIDHFHIAFEKKTRVLLFSVFILHQEGPRKYQ